MKDNYFGKQLKELRIAHGLSQRELGDVFGFSNQAVSFWESGRSDPDLDMLVAIAKYFNVSTDELLGLKD